MSDLGELERGANHARDNLMRTLDEVNRKATATAQEFFLSDQPIRRYPIASVCGAMALGFAAGGWKTPAVVFGIVAIANVLASEPENEQ
jgi:hypothetical protein